MPMTATSCAAAAGRTFAGHVLWFPAPEDLVLVKLKVGRDRDFDDAIRVVERNRASLNRSYLLRWAGKLRIVDELDYVLGLPSQAD